MKTKFKSFLAVGITAIGISGGFAIFNGIEQATEGAKAVGGFLPHLQEVNGENVNKFFKDFVLESAKKNSIEDLLASLPEESPQEIKDGKLDSIETLLTELGSNVEKNPLPKNTELSKVSFNADLLNGIQSTAIQKDVSYGKSEIAVSKPLNLSIGTKKEAQEIHDLVLEKNKINTAIFPVDKDLLDTMVWASKLVEKTFGYKDDRTAFAMLGAESSFGNLDGQNWKEMRGKTVGGEQALGPMQVMPSFVKQVMSPANPYTKKARELIYQVSPEIASGGNILEEVNKNPKLQVLFGYIALTDIVGQKQIVNPPKGVSKIEAISRTYNAGPSTANWYGPENNAHASNSQKYYDALKNIDKTLADYNKAYVAQSEQLEITRLAQSTIPNMESILDKISANEVKYDNSLNETKLSIK